jgi:hypothetical protein
MPTPGYDNPVLFNWTEPQNGLGSFILTPKNNGGNIDIHNEFDWTLTPREGRQHIPKAILTEYRQTQSSELRGYLYSARGKASDFAIAGNIGAEPTKVFFQEAGATIKQATAGTTNELVTSAGSTIEKGIGVATESLDILQKTDLQKGLPAWAQNALNPYTGLYAVEPTKFSYTVPYYTSTNMMGINNSWGKAGTGFIDAGGDTVNGIVEMMGGKDSAPSTGSSGTTSSQNSFLGKIGATVGNLAMGAVKTANAAAKMALNAGAGAYGSNVSEAPKAYKGSDANETVEIDFYLYNTIDQLDNLKNSIKRNWEFCYLITYQNLPDRKGINYLDAPVLYKVEIPGYKQLPLAYLSSISITNIGNVRLIDIETGEIAPQASGASIKMIPEAYHIKFTLTSVLTNTRNLFLFNADPGQGINVTVTPSSGT